MSLDEALDFELGLLGDDGGAIDPHETTAVSSDHGRHPQTGIHAETGPTANERPATPASPVGPALRNLVFPALLVLVLVGAGVVYASSGPSTGEVHIDTEPDGAQVIVDDVTVLGATTPYTAHLEVGRHTVRLEREGFEPRELTVNVHEGEQAIDGTAGRLKPLPDPEPREIRVTASPADALLSADGTPFGTGAGASLIIEPDQSVRVTAVREGCQTLGYLLSHRYERETLHLELANCAVPAPDAGTEAVATAPTRRPERPHREPDPERGEPPQKDATSEPMGCLNLRLDYPVKATIAVDGESLGEREWRLANHPLAVGTHKVRVQNAAVGVDETFEVRIKPGRDCASHFFRSD